MIAETCDRCGTPHDPARCNAHSKGRNGGQCGRPPTHNSTVCQSHGAGAPQVRAAGKARAEQERARKALGKLVVVPVDNPLEELRNLAGEAVAWKRVCAAAVAQLERLRYSTDGGEQIRGEIQLFERAIDRCNTILVGIAKLNLDERIARIAESHLNAVTQALLQACAEQGITGPQRTAVMLGVAKYLRPSPN